MKINKSIKGPEKRYFGKDKESGEAIYFSKPTFDCGWYWGFGYLGNINCHYHLSGYANGRNINMYDALIKDYNLCNALGNGNLWEFCEVAKTIYSLKETAEVLGRGGSHYTNNPFKGDIINKDEVERINNILIPKMAQYLYDMLK